MIGCHQVMLEIIKVVLKYWVDVGAAHLLYTVIDTAMTASA